MVRSAIQLYTLRNVDQPFAEVLGRVADAGFDGVEFAYRVPEESPAEVVQTLDRTGLDVAGAHVSIDDLENEFEKTVAFYDALGCDHLVVPSLSAESFESRDAIAEAADDLAALEAALAEHGFDLHYHNHDHEYVDLGDETGFDAFVEATDVGIELDLGLALVGGDDPVERLESLDGRSMLAHLKDVDAGTGESVPVGEGDLPLEECAAAFRENGGEWLIYEYEGEDPLETLDEAAKAVDELR